MERLHMNYLKDIINRLRAGESERQISRDMKISRPTVHKYYLVAKEEGYLNIEEQMPGEAQIVEVLGPEPHPPRIPSSLEKHREVVQRYLDQGVEMTAIWLRLKENYGYEGSYSSVRRFVRHLRPVQKEAFIRVHTQPGEEMQVDFGTVGQMFDPNSGRMRTTYLFVATLCYSRHQYAELVFDQKAKTWIGLHQRAFEYFGGVPKRVKPDNLKAAVLEALVYDPVLGEAYRQMALHYGFLISPTAPGEPQQKGKVENGVHYVKRNFLAGQDFVDIYVCNQRLKIWIENTAGVRQHGTTHQAPLHLFREYEQAALQPLPEVEFALLEIKMVKVHPDCHVTIDGSYYSVSYVHIGKELTAHIGERLVEIYEGSSLIATHVRLREAGKWSTRYEDYPAYKATYLTHTPEYCRNAAEHIGPAVSQVVERMLGDRPLDRLRSVQAILRLGDTVGSQRLEAACARALHFGNVRYRSVKEILNAALDRDPLPDAPEILPGQPHTFARKAEEFFTGVIEVQP
jgi:transposase